MDYEFLPHTADAKFQAFGKRLDLAFANAAYAMTDIITNHRKVRRRVKRYISIKSESRESLLYDFLEKFIFLLDTDGFLLRKLNHMKLTETDKGFKLVAFAFGDNQPERYESETTIKAVTYQEMFVKKKDDRWIVQVVVDI